jgi:hypothetical protein
MADSGEHDPADALAAMTGGGSAGDAIDDAQQPAGDDDMMAAPAPDASVFAPRRTTRDLATDRHIHNRRTLIPILLTCGVLLPAIGSLKWLRGPESPFAAWPMWAPLLLAACGLLMLLLAFANMRQVRHMMRASRLPARHTV